MLQVLQTMKSIHFKMSKYLRMRIYLEEAEAEVDSSCVHKGSGGGLSNESVAGRCRGSSSAGARGGRDFWSGRWRFGSAHEHTEEAHHDKVHLEQGCATALGRCRDGLLRPPHAQLGHQSRQKRVQADPVTCCLAIKIRGQN